ncbi:hypothetical protein N7539_003123 [Penicillium diatomitis]|uniref:Uncharacterized protein n=1 Tax=Penicillium diatomitis TaxID=2819901 RepID=A0A9W9XG09_9EURO|nr:uncharacterized protein N7539_003123 [Penicillium diatomitis]KAJ5491556.1 hypothetical protein N7539_003123 [Penicillium diatomitis]
MIRSQLRQIASHGDRAWMGMTAMPIRQFSVSHVAAAEGPAKPTQPRGEPRQRPAPTGPPRKPRPSSRPAPSSSTGMAKGSGAGNTFKPRPARAIDARSLAAAPRTGGEPPKIIRRPRPRTGPPGKPMLGRKGKLGAKGAQKPRRTKKTRRSAEDFDEDESVAAAIKKAEDERELKMRPVPVPYEPKQIDFAALKETWPALPTTTHARSAAIIERLSTLSGRFPGGYVPPHELGRRLYKGQSVLFETEAEKTEALEEVKRLAQARADKVSQRKGEPIEPRDIKFSAVSQEHTQALMETYVQGKYPTVEIGKDQPAVMGEVLRNLRNNSTYQTAGKRPQFLAKVESLLASSRVKRS